MLPPPLSCASGNSLGLQLYLEIQPLSVLHVLHVHPFLSIRSCVTPEVAPSTLETNSLGISPPNGLQNPPGLATLV